jgi:hypothetical protein
MEEKEERTPETELDPSKGELEDLDVPEEDEDDVRGGRKAGGTQQDF